MIAVERLSFGWNSVQADVAEMRPSWVDPRPTIFEVKVTRADFRSDMRSGKWRRYLKIAERVIFAVPKGMIENDEVPAECGIVIRRPDRKDYRKPGGWYTARGIIGTALDLKPLHTFTLALLLHQYPSGWDGPARLRRELAPVIERAS
jgi:hypothetical protein